MLGIHHQLLLEQCLALMQKFSCKPRCFQKLSAGLYCDLSEGLYHERHFMKFNLIDENLTNDYKREVNKWCGIASYFFENRNNCILLTSTFHDKTLTKDRQWPPEPLEHVDVFSQDLLWRVSGVLHFYDSNIANRVENCNSTEEEKQEEVITLVISKYAWEQGIFGSDSLWPLGVVCVHDTGGFVGRIGKGNQNKKYCYEKKSEKKRILCLPVHV